jgi:hypothetical protein
MAGTPIRFRKLRIAWSVVCGAACLLVIVLWVRAWSVSEISYIWQAGNGKYAFLGSSADQFRLIVWDHPTTNIYNPCHWAKVPINHFGFWTLRTTDFSGVICGVAVTPTLAVLVSVAVAAAPWLRWRFTLRTLLIAMTLVASVLGLVVWLR